MTDKYSYIESLGLHAGFQQKPVVDAFLKLIEHRDKLLEICIELREAADYWSEYDVPIGIVERLERAINFGVKK